jgi:hypothetical protein
MFEVKYGYYNYPMKNRNFDSYEAARKFFYFIGKKNGVKRVELNKV